MKTKTTFLKKTYLLIFTSILYFSTQAQVYNGNLTLTSQAEVNTFNYTEVTGYLDIYGNDILNLSGLLSLTTVGNDLNIHSSNAITSLAGLSNLTSVGGAVYIHKNIALTSLAALGNLTSVGEGLWIYENNVLTNLAGLGNITSLGGLSRIYDNPALISLSGLDNLTHVSGNLSIYNNPELTNLTGLGNLTTVVEDLKISNNDALSSLVGLGKLSSVGKRLDIMENKALVSLNGLNNLTIVRETLSINKNAVLTSFAGLENLNSVGKSFIISENNSLTSIAGLENLTSIGLFLTISDNAVLTSLSGLENITSLEASLTISNNDVLTNLAGLENLTSVEGKVTISNNDVLTNIAGIRNLTSAKEIDIWNNPALTTLDGLENITSLEWKLGIGNNPALTSLAGLENLTLIGWDLEIYGDNGVTSLEDLENLTSVGRDIIITNTTLTSLTGLHNLASVETNLEILGNNALTNLSGLENLTSIGGDLLISLNNGLTSLEGLVKLSSVGTNLSINRNNELASLAGLNDLTTVGGDLRIYNNTVLPSLAGLNDLTTVGGDLRIYNNTVLPSLAGIDNLTSVGLVIRIHDNAALISLMGLENITTANTVIIYENDILSSFCALFGLINGGGLTGVYQVYRNAANPTKQEIIDAGPCNLNGLPAETSIILSAEGALTITDINAGVSDDDITLSVVSSKLQIANTVPNFEVAGTGVNIIDAYTVQVPLVNITNGIFLDGVSGTDNVSLDSALTLTGDFSLINVTTYNQNANLTVNGNVTYSLGSGLSLGKTTVSGDFSVSANGSIGDSGVLTISGTSSFTTNASSDITLDNTDFVGSVSVSCRHATLLDDNSIDIGNAVVFGNLDVTAGGAVTHDPTEVLQVNGSTNCIATGFDISFSGDNNQFNGPVSLDGANIYLKSRALHTLTLNYLIATGNINVIEDTGSIQLTGNITTSASGITSLNGQGDIEQTGGSIQTNTLNLNTPGNINVNEISNNVVSLNINDLGNTDTAIGSFTNSGNLIMGSIKAQKLDVTAPILAINSSSNIALGSGESNFIGNITSQGGTIGTALGSILNISGESIDLSNMVAFNAPLTTVNIIGTSSSNTTAGDNLDYGFLNVMNGTFDLNAANDVDITSQMTIDNGGSLVGTGTLDGPVNLVQGNLAAGNNIGIINTGNLQLQSGSDATFEINGPTPGADHDQVVVNGTIDVTGATLTIRGGYPNNPADAIILIDNNGSEDPIIGTFNNFNEGDIVNVGDFSATLTYIGGDGNDLALISAVAPTISCPADITVDNDAGQCGAIVSFTDQNAATAIGIPEPNITYSPASGSLFSVGTTEVIATATNDAGTVSCTFNVIVNDTEVPVPDLATLPDVLADCEVTELTEPIATDNCAGVVTVSHDASFPISGEGTTIITWTYDDGNGNTVEQTQQVIIEDVTPPVPDLATLHDVLAECEVTELTEPTATDNCNGIVTVTNDAILPISGEGSTVVTWTYDDGNGNTVSQTQQVIISDLTAPVPDVAVLSDLEGKKSVAMPTAPIATDNCGGVITATTDAIFPITEKGLTIITWVYDDGNGNSVIQTQNVIVNNVKPHEIRVNHYPNPFRESITFAFEVPYGTNFSINIFNQSGSLVAQLTNGTYNNDTYLVTWNASYVSDGIYFYKLLSNGLQVGKGTILKSANSGN